jgi:carboxylate-amine ligase
MRSGLDAEVVDFVKGLRLPMRQSIHDLLDFVDDVLDDLRTLVESEQGTGADRQIALYQQTGSTDEVIRLLMQQTMQGVAVPLA